MKKYELTEETLTVSEKTLYRIRAVRDFGSVKTGEFGGYIEKEENLSHFGNAWISGDAWVYGDARVSGNAWASGDARVFGNARVSDNARVFGNAWVYGDARVSGNAWAYGEVQVAGNAWIYGDARVSGDAWVYGDARVSGNARVSDNARVFGNAWVYGDARVSGNAWAYGEARVSGNAWAYGNAEVFNTRHFFVQGPIGSRDGYVTFYRTKDDTVEVRCGCFSGSLQEFVNQVEETHGGSRYEKEYKLAAELAKVCIRLEGESR